MTWYEAALFVNWLNTNTEYPPAYNFTNGTMYLCDAGQAWTLDGTNLYRNKNAFYFLPSDEEWYKAAYHKNDGVTSNYWDYAAQTNGVPRWIDASGDTAFDAVFWQGYYHNDPNVVTNAGLASAYGTMSQSGNMAEWMESALDGTNGLPDAPRTFRGGGWMGGEATLRASFRFSTCASGESMNVGFRVASVLAPIPEPGAMAGMAPCALAIMGHRVWKRSL